jgi:hypothetical protein
MSRGLILSACLLSLAPTNAFAQSTSVAPTAPSSTAAQEPGGTTNRTRLMLGVDLKETITPGADTSNKLGLGFMWRWRSRTASVEDRWAFSYRLGSYSTRVSSPVGGESLEMGPARFRPLLVGAEYKMPRGKWTWGASLNAGWSLNKLDTSATFRDRLANAMGTGEVTTDIHNSFAFSPRFKGWYDFNRRVSFMVETYYAYNRPEVTIRSGGVDLSRRLNADAVIFKTGLVYGIW